jgi:muramoyltetrapeptide carboxypeptidase
VTHPPPLAPGDVVRVVAPSGPFEPALFEAGLAVLRDRFRLVPRMRGDVGARRGYLAGDDARRAAEWAEAVADPEARAIWFARGGYGAMRILPAIDPAPLVAAPRWVVGFSDATAIHAALNRAGLATLHAPVITQLGRVTPAALDALGRTLFGGGDPPALAGSAVIGPGVARGVVLGGSLTLLAHLCGTPYLPSFEGAILCFEDVTERPYRLDRYLTQLRLSGALRGLRGVCVGHLTECDAVGQSGAEAVREVVAQLGVPAIAGLPVGHEAENHPLVLGARARLEAPAPGEPGSPRLVYEPEGSA